MQKLLLALGACLAAASAAADPVSVRYGFNHGGNAAAMHAFVREAKAIQDRINPGAKTELWMESFHGSNVGGGSVIVHYPDMMAFAKATETNQSNEEWAAQMAKMPDTMTLDYSGVGSSLWMEDGFDAASGGEVMAIFTMQVVSGSTENLVAQAQKASALHESMGIDSVFRVSAPMAAGPNTGTASVLVRYPSAAAWGEAVGKLNASAEWQEFLASFPVDQYRGVYSGMSTAMPL